MGADSPKKQDTKPTKAEAVAILNKHVTDGDGNNQGNNTNTATNNSNQKDNHPTSDMARLTKSERRELQAKTSGLIESRNQLQAELAPWAGRTSQTPRVLKMKSAELHIREMRHLEQLTKQLGEAELLYHVHPRSKEIRNWDFLRGINTEFRTHLGPRLGDAPPPEDDTTSSSGSDSEEEEEESSSSDEASTLVAKRGSPATTRPGKQGITGAKRKRSDEARKPSKKSKLANKIHKKSGGTPQPKAVQAVSRATGDASSPASDGDGDGDGDGESDGNGDRDEDVDVAVYSDDVIALAKKEKREKEGKNALRKYGKDAKAKSTSLAGSDQPGRVQTPLTSAERRALRKQQRRQMKEDENLEKAAKKMKKVRRVAEEEPGANAEFDTHNDTGESSTSTTDENENESENDKRSAQRHSGQPDPQAQGTESQESSDPDTPCPKGKNFRRKSTSVIPLPSYSYGQIAARPATTPTKQRPCVKAPSAFSGGKQRRIRVEHAYRPQVLLFSSKELAKDPPTAGGSGNSSSSAAPASAHAHVHAQNNNTTTKDHDAAAASSRSGKIPLTMPISQANNIIHDTVDDNDNRKAGRNGVTPGRAAASTPPAASGPASAPHATYADNGELIRLLSPSLRAIAAFSSDNQDSERKQAELLEKQRRDWHILAEERRQWRQAMGFE